MQSKEALSKIRSIPLGTSLEPGTRSIRSFRHRLFLQQPLVSRLTNQNKGCTTANAGSAGLDDAGESILIVRRAG